MPAPLSPILLIGAYKAIGEKLYPLGKSPLRKYTHEPYHVHTDGVEALVAGVDPNDIIGRAAAHGHDIYEDVLFGLTQDEFKARMLEELELLGLPVGVSLHLGETSKVLRAFADKINEVIIELSDVYTREAFPQHNRKARKALENQRVAGISVTAKTVKLADLIDNSASIVEYDANFAKVFMAEKEALLPFLKEGHPYLLSHAEIVLNNYKAKATYE